jgi:hypothetical protein
VKRASMSYPTNEQEALLALKNADTEQLVPLGR